VVDAPAGISEMAALMASAGGGECAATADGVVSQVVASRSAPRKAGDRDAIRASTSYTWAS
jgi:hypothetical protein